MDGVRVAVGTGLGLTVGVEAAVSVGIGMAVGLGATVGVVAGVTMLVTAARGVVVPAVVSVGILEGVDNGTRVATRVGERRTTVGEIVRLGSGVFIAERLGTADSEQASVIPTSKPKVVSSNFVRTGMTIESLAKVIRDGSVRTQRSSSFLPINRCQTLTY